MVARITNENNKVVPVKRKEKETCYNKIISIVNVTVQGRMSLCRPGKRPGGWGSWLCMALVLKLVSGRLTGKFCDCCH